MLFTDNLVVLMIVCFFSIYFFIFETKIFNNHLQSHSRSNFIAISSLIFYATWYPPAILLLIYHAVLGYYGGKFIYNGLKNQDKFSA